MTSSTSSPPVPSEIDDEVDDASLPVGEVWAYPCRFPYCPDYGKSWLLRSNFLSHLREGKVHATILETRSDRRAIELEWRYNTDPHLPPRAAPNFRPREDPDEHVWEYGFRDSRGNLISGRGTLRQIEMHKASQAQAEGNTTTT